MKKIFLFIAGLGLLSIVSCNNDDGGKSPSDGGDNPNVYTKYDNKTQTPNNCALVLWGEDEGMAFWSLIPFIGENPEDSSSYVDYEFFTDDIPTSNNCIFNNVYWLTVEGVDVDITSVSNGSVKVTNYPSFESSSITFQASATVNGKSLETKYSGRVELYDESGESRPSNEIPTKEERKRIISELLAK